MKLIGRVSFYIVLSLLLSYLSFKLKSDFLSSFYENDLVSILITLLAIIIATFSLIITKLQEISSKKPTVFTKTYNELRKTIKVQIFLIAFAIVFLIIKNSSIIHNGWAFSSEVVDFFNTIIFICALDILRDVGCAIFDIIMIFNNLDNPDHNDK